MQGSHWNLFHNMVISSLHQMYGIFSSHVSHGPPFTLHLNVAATSAANVSLALQLLKTCAVAVTRGGRGGGRSVVGDGLTVKRSLNVFFVSGSMCGLEITCIKWFPSSTFLYVCPETPMDRFGYHCIMLFVQSSYMEFYDFYQVYTERLQVSLHWKKLVHLFQIVDSDRLSGTPVSLFTKIMLALLQKCMHVVSYY